MPYVTMSRRRVVQLSHLGDNGVFKYEKITKTPQQHPSKHEKRPPSVLWLLDSSYKRNAFNSQRLLVRSQNISPTKTFLRIVSRVNSIDAILVLLLGPSGCHRSTQSKSNVQTLHTFFSISAPVLTENLPCLDHLNVRAVAVRKICRCKPGKTRRREYC